MEYQVKELQEQNRLLRMKINEIEIRIGGLLTKLHFSDKERAFLEIQEGKRIEEATKERQ